MRMRVRLHSAPPAWPSCPDTPGLVAHTARLATHTTYTTHHYQNPTPWQELLSVPRAKKNSQHIQNSHIRNYLPKGSRLALNKKFFPEWISSALGKDIKKTLSELQTFCIRNIHLYKTYIEIWHNFNSICFITILHHSRQFFRIRPT
jgi:hypothetical protein